jgi:hypothetical protein
MTPRFLGSTCAAVVLAATAAAAQAPTSAPTPGSQLRPADRASTPTPRIQTDRQVTLTGCVARQGSDIILASAMPSGNASGGVPGSTSTGPAGTAGTTSAPPVVGTAGSAGSRYRLSGERDLDQFIGQRVEIVGRMDPDAVGVAGKAPAAPTPLGTPGLGRPGGSGVGTPESSGVGTPNSSGAGTPGNGVGAPPSGVGVPPSSGVGTPGAGSTDATPGATTPAASEAISRAAAQAPMPHVTIMSVRAVGGSCQ